MRCDEHHAPMTGGPGRSDEPRRLAIVDDHELFADALRVWVTESLERVEVVYAGPDPRSVPDGTDLVLLDIDLGADESPAEDVTAGLVERGIAVLLVSSVGDAELIRPAIAAGALGYVPKREGGDVLHEAVDAALQGQIYVSPDLAAVMMVSIGRPEFSAQERTALRLYASGLKLDAVSRRMNVSPSTVREYLARVRRKYSYVGRDVRTKTDLYAAAVKDGIIEPR
jgi:two-component system, NarL family, uhpT operon response regulator UhpA